MKKLITATALAAFAIATSTAMAQDTKDPTKKTPTQQQMETRSTDSKMAPSATTGAAPEQNSSTMPGKPTDTIKDSAGADSAGAAGSAGGAGGAGGGNGQ
jgi:hypothetical protein